MWIFPDAFNVKQCIVCSAIICLFFATKEGADDTWNEGALKYADIIECFQQWMINLNHPGESTRNSYIGGMRRFFAFW